MSKGLFVTATGTDAGKTYVSALIVKKLRAFGFNCGYYKAVLSGAEKVGDELIPGDCRYVTEIAGIQGSPSEFVSYVLQDAVSPHLAADLANIFPDIKVITKDFQKISTRFDYLLMEGSGGIICPLCVSENDKLMLADVIKALDLDIVIVSGSGLGSINSVYLTCFYARQNGINIKGIILNQYDEKNIIHADNKNIIPKLTGVPVIACIKKDDIELDMDVRDVAEIFSEIVI